MELHGFFEDGMPFIFIRVEGKEFKALVDTGYDGFVLLPEEEIRKLKLMELGKTQYATADGKLHEGKIYRGKLEFFGASYDVAVDCTEGSFTLIGMKFLQPLRFVMIPSQGLLSLSTEP